MYKIDKSKIQGKGVIATQEILDNKLIGISHVLRTAFTLEISETLKLKLDILTEKDEKKIGLMGTDKLDDDKAKMFMNANRCTMGNMSYPINLVWLSNNYKIIKVERAEVGKEYVNPEAVHFMEVSVNVKLPSGLQLVFPNNSLIFTTLGKFINHSEKPNCKSFKIKNYYYICTLKLIKVNEELTIDYRLQPELEQL